MTLSDPAVDPKWWSAIDVHGRFHDEHIAFGVACRFANAAAKSARLGNELLAEEFADFSEKVRNRYLYPENYIIAHLFVGQISSFELFLQDLLTVVLRKFPKKIGSHTLKLSEVLELEDIDELVVRAAEEAIYKLAYKKPFDYLKEVCELLSFDSRLIEKDWRVFVEAKARRDLGVHAGWVCNDTYLRKVAEAQLTTVLRSGDVALPTDYAYLREVADALYRMAGLVYQSTSEKLGV